MRGKSTCTDDFTNNMNFRHHRLLAKSFQAEKCKHPTKHGGIAEHLIAHAKTAPALFLNRKKMAAKVIYITCIRFLKLALKKPSWFETSSRTYSGKRPMALYRS